MEEDDENESVLTSVPEQGKDEEAPEQGKDESVEEIIESDDEESVEEMDLEVPENGTRIPEQGTPENGARTPENGARESSNEVPSETDGKEPENLEDEIEFVENSEQFVDLDTFSSPMSTPSLEFTEQEQEVPELEQQLENTPTSSSGGQEGQDYALNAPSYESGYEEKGYDQRERKQDLRDREMTVGIEPTSLMEFSSDTEPRQIDMRTFQRQMQEQETGRGHSEEDYIVRARQLKEDESLPFQERKKKRELI